MSKVIREWNEKELIAKVSGQVLRGMNRACQFVAEQAKGRMRKRTGLAASEVNYVVQPERNSVVGYVGVKKGQAFYWYFHEVGTSKMPPHPAIRPAVFENADQIVKLIAEG